MKHFKIEISYYKPYPKTLNAQVTATNLATGVARALREFRKNVKGQRISELKISVVDLGKIL